MSFEQNFCPSPWFHMRINNQGHYEYCRWATQRDRTQQKTIQQVAPIQWFQTEMSHVRKSMLDGVLPSGCASCKEMEQHGKVSGREKQLLKIGVRPEYFAKSLRSSPWWRELEWSQMHQGMTEQMPQDLQIDLGNHCNSACLFCSPFSSSRLATEFKRIGLIDAMPPRSWCDDEHSLDVFLSDIARLPNIAYLHFIGGETLITPAFRKILDRLIAAGLSEKLTVGFTTNLTVWDQSIVDRLRQFRSVNLGVSVEAIHPVNDYVRYGGSLEQTLELLDQWSDVARDQNWYMQIRTTPTVLTVGHLDTIYDYAIPRGLSVESCNFLQNPVFMKPSVLPPIWRQHVIERLSRFRVNIGQIRSINTRNPEDAKQQCIEDVDSYINYLQNSPDDSALLPDLIDYLHRMESIHSNRVLDYLPEYEDLFRSAGYQN